MMFFYQLLVFFSSRRRHTRYWRDWSSDVCSSDLDMHNLFGDTNAVHVSVSEKGYAIEQIIDGETVAEVLDYVQYSPKKLVRTLETWVTKSVKEGKISLEEGKEFLSNYRSGLYGYTYLE